MGNYEHGERRTNCYDCEWEVDQSDHCQNFNCCGVSGAFLLEYCEFVRGVKRGPGYPYGKMTH